MATEQEKLDAYLAQARALVPADVELSGELKDYGAEWRLLVQRGERRLPARWRKDALMSVENFAEEIRAWLLRHSV